MKVLERKSSREAHKSQNTSVIEVVDEDNNDQPALQNKLPPIECRRVIHVTSFPFLHGGEGATESHAVFTGPGNRRSVEIAVAGEAVRVSKFRCWDFSRDRASSFMTYTK